jgi:Ser/Thr protein kinase RdoA (MazF antagonist)
VLRVIRGIYSGVTGWSEELAEELARAALDEVGVGEAPMTLIRFRGPFASFRVENPPLLLKVAATESDNERLGDSLRIGRFLREAGVEVTAPAVELAPEPVRIDGYTAGLWHWAPGSAGRPDPERTGRSLRALHETLAGYGEQVPELEPFGASDLRLDRILEDGTLPPDSVDFLRARLNALRDVWDGFESSLGTGPLHGDFKISNLLATPDGPLIMDLDYVRVGPWEWDLATISRGRHDGWDAEEWTAFSAGYGHELRAQRDAEALRELTHLGALIFQFIPHSSPLRLARGEALLDEWLHHSDRRCHDLDWDGAFLRFPDPPA